MRRKPTKKQLMEALWKEMKYTEKIRQTIPKEATQAEPYMGMFPLGKLKAWEV